MKMALAPILWVLFLVAMFIITYILNKKTHKPKGCEDIIKNAGCRGCKMISCGHHPSAGREKK